MKLITADYALPHAHADIVTDFAVVVDADRIVAAGDRVQMQRAYPQALVERFTGMLLMPAFVNAHDHGRGLGTASLGISDDKLEKWILSLRAQPEIPPYLTAAYDAAMLLRSGVTLTAHSHNPRRWHAMHAESLETVRGYRDAGIRVAFHPPIVDQNNLVYENQEHFVETLPEEVRDIGRSMLPSKPLDVSEYLAICSAVFDACHDGERHTVHIQVSPAGGQWCSDALITACVEWARTRGTRMQMHLLETRYQRDYALHTFGKSFVRHLDDIGALGPWATLAHMVWADTEDFPLLAERSVGVVHNPSSNLRLRSGIAPLAEMAQAGVRLGLGLDGHGLDDDQDFLREIRLAHTLSAMRVAQMPAETHGPSEQDVLAMATHGGAGVTLGIDGQLGRLAQGFLADMIVLAPSDVMLWQVEHGHGVEMLTALASRRHVRHVMTGGEWAVREGVCTRCDEQSLLREIMQMLRHSDSKAAALALQQAHKIALYLERHLKQVESQS